ncbi:hypothetical protein CDV31_007686 [Fusarium ambrosium]|uniref:Heterokaryon incompatibility domain-containing protein n=1 Tax=Fusarium ambrosium TaxID=131363 RepID=A0A428U5K7_9HYPO|nr:hypothetical protein CDV31_007686 [Fusarium ambrosium]
MAEVGHLCDACVSALRCSFASGSNGNHHSTLGAVRQAVRDGCFVCSRTWNVDEQGLFSAKHDQEKSIYDESHLPVMCRANFTSAGGDKGEQFICLFVLGSQMFTEFRIVAKKALKPSYTSPWPALEDRTSSSRSLDQAYDWLTCCRAQHGPCNRLSGSGKWLPTRLIDVGSEGDDLWKLSVVAEDLLHPSSPPYITLSYRWGTEPSIVLLGSNIDEFRGGKPICDLPLTFRELITVSRRFSIRYAWIDALCIIQDSPQDWASESAAMRHVYANSACTIAASASSGPEGGLFRSRHPELMRPGVVNIAYGDGMSEDYYIWEKDYWSIHFDRSELLKRGWIFQERFLSPRVLYFGHEQILWECMTDNKCEGFPGGIPDHTSDKSSHAVSQVVASRSSGLDGQEAPFSDDMFNLWGGLVERYAGCSLTKQTDKLAAFAGIAKLFQENTGDEYVSGLWKTCLAEMLCWKVFHPEPGPADYLAPSWSWASVQSSVGAPLREQGRKNVNLVSVMAIETTNREADPTVGVRYGSEANGYTRQIRTNVFNNKQAVIV